MEKGSRVLIVNISHAQQYDEGRPVKTGARGIITGRTGGGAWILELIDPMDNRRVSIWFIERDLVEL